MRGAVLHAPGDIRLEARDDPTIVEPTDAIIRLSATCVCGSDLWPYRGIETVQVPTPMGHEYVGIVEEVGSAVRTIKPGQFVIGSFLASDNTCEICQAGYQSSCNQGAGSWPHRAGVPRAVFWTTVWVGAPGRNRTCDSRFRKPLLYPLSYEGRRKFPWAEPPATTYLHTPRIVGLISRRLQRVQEFARLAGKEELHGHSR
jgi:hypothetical protein